MSLCRNYPALCEYYHLNPPSVLMGRRQLPLFSKQVVAYVKSSQSKVSLGSFNLMTNMPPHKPTDFISAVATRKMLISNSQPCPCCGCGSRAQRVQRLRKESSTWSPNFISLIIDCMPELQPTMLSGQILHKHSPHTFKIKLSHEPYSHRKPNNQNDLLSSSAQPRAAFQYD